MYQIFDAGVPKMLDERFDAFLPAMRQRNAFRVSAQPRQCGERGQSQFAERVSVYMAPLLRILDGHVAVMCLNQVPLTQARESAPYAGGFARQYHRQFVRGEERMTANGIQ